MGCYMNVKRKDIDYLIDNVIQAVCQSPSGKKLFVFLPYKASMWTSLESIRKAVSEGTDCEAVVMPVPCFGIKENIKKIL